MRPIKFRGRDRRGNVFFGCYDDSTATINDFDYAAMHVVEPDSVAQLGDVIDGVEYYDGDERFVDGKSFICRVKTVWEAKS